MSGLSLYDKVWQAHVVREADGQALLYIDRHLIHEVTSPQPFDGLRLAGRKPWRVDAVQAVPDHNVPTLHPEREIEDAVSRAQVEALERNCAEFGIRLFGRRDPRQGIVHVVGPEQGLTLPGMTVVCGDSHTSTHGAFAALAFGIGTSEVEHVLATQCLPQKKTKSMRIVIDGALQPGVFAKDLMLAVIRTIGTAGGTGYTLEFAGSAIRALSMEGRMTMCNMSIEAGARAGLVAVDETTLAYLRGRPSAPQGALWDAAEAYWRTLVSDEDARFDAEVVLDAAAIAPQVSWGTWCRILPTRAMTTSATLMRARLIIWACTRGRRWAIFGSMRSSSAPAPTRASKICASPPASCKGARWRRILKRRWSCPVPGWSRRRRRRKASTAFLSPPVLNGAGRAARCVWR